MNQNSAMIVKMWLALGMLLSLSSGIARAEVPTSRPAATTMPSHVSKKEPLPKGWVAVEHSSHQFRYFVSKKWPHEDNGPLTTYTLAEPQNKAPTTFSIEAGSCHVDTLENVADFERKEFPTEWPGAKILTDQAFELGGRPAWMFVVEVPHTGTFTMTGRPPQTFVVKTREMEIVAIQGSTRYYLNLFADNSTYAAGYAFAKRAIDSFEWLVPPPATQP